jgi:hypothetical protein
MPTQKTRRRWRLSKILKSGTNLTRIKNRVLPSLERSLCTSHSISSPLPPSKLLDNHKTHPERAFRRYPSSTWRSITLILSFTISFQRPMLTRWIILLPEVSCWNSRGAGLKIHFWGTTPTRLRGMECHRTSLRQERVTS